MADHDDEQVRGARPPWFTQMAGGWEVRDLCRVAFSESGNALNPRYSHAPHVQVVERVVLQINFRRGGWRALLGVGPYPMATVPGLHGELLEVPTAWLLTP